MTNFMAVVTTIAEPTDSVRALLHALVKFDASLIAIGDLKGPPHFNVSGAEFLSLADQMRLPYKLASLLPTGHYTRKNLGYLYAMDRGASFIYETDDDNSPKANWSPRSSVVKVQHIESRPWFNVYRAFTNEVIWPRGFPLDRIQHTEDSTSECHALIEEVVAPIQQGLSDGSPDVDAVWRLVFNQEFSFRPGPSLYLTKGTWCPFNSQSTWWWPVAYPLMYLPSFCSFRMTDIWRSFVAQRCLWELDMGLVFHGAEVYQNRNLHNLMRDFEDEIPGYRGNTLMTQILEEIRLDQGPVAITNNMTRCYEALTAAGFFHSDELTLLHAWIRDLESIIHGHKP